MNADGLIFISSEEFAMRLADHPPEYRADVEAAAAKMDATGLWFEPKDWMRLLAKYNARGFGTHVYRVAHPIARALDSVLGTNLSNCGGCAGRMERWNGPSEKA